MKTKEERKKEKLLAKKKKADQRAEKRKEEYLAIRQRQLEAEKFKAEEAESGDRINKLLQLSHMLIAASTNFFSEAEDLLHERGLTLEPAINKSHEQFIRSSNSYFKEFAEMIRTEDEKNGFWDNLQDLEPRVRRWAGLESDDTWIKVEDGIPEPGHKVIVETKDGDYGFGSTADFGGDIRWKGSSRYTDTIVAWMPIPKRKEIKQ